MSKNFRRQRNSKQEELAAAGNAYASLYAPLEAREQKEAMRRYISHGRKDRTIEDRVWRANTKLVLKKARRFFLRTPHVSLSDLLSEGTLGLLRAMRTYDPDLSSFTTYAGLWIETYVRRFCVKNSKIASGVSPLLQAIFDHYAEVERVIAGGDDKKIEHLASHLGASREDIALGLSSMRYSSLDTTVVAYPDTDKENNKIPLPTALAEEHELRADMRAAVLGFRQGLSSYEQAIFDKRIAGVDSDWEEEDAPPSLHELGEQFGLSHTKVSNDEHALRHRFRSYLREKKIHHHLSRYAMSGNSAGNGKARNAGNTKAGNGNSTGAESQQDPAMLYARVRDCLDEYGSALHSAGRDNLSRARYSLFRHNVNPFTNDNPLRIPAAAKLFGMAPRAVSALLVDVVIRAEDYLEQHGLPTDFYSVAKESFEKPLF